MSLQIVTCLHLFTCSSQPRYFFSSDQSETKYHTFHNISRQQDLIKLASVHRRYPPWRVTVYIRAMSLTPTLRRHFRQQFWPHEKTEPLLLPFEAWAFTWYKYCPASNVPLWEICTESLCDMSLARTFRRHFRRKFWPHETSFPGNIASLIHTQKFAVSYASVWLV